MSGIPIAVTSALYATVLWSLTVGSTGVFDCQVDGKTLSFRYIEGKIIDRETASVWDITGQAIEGKQKGRRLSPIPHGDYFAFAWLAFKPEI